MYEGLPIATNKLPLAERKSIPHHLLGCIKLDEEPWTVGKYVDTAHDIINDIVDRGKLPIVVGGTFYYIQSLLFRTRPVCDNAEYQTAEALEKKWPILAASTKDMLDELRAIDPEQASRWHPNDRRKIRRSLEIFLTSGRKPSDLYLDQRKSIAMVKENKILGQGAGAEEQTSTKEASPLLHFDFLFLWINANLEKLSARLDQRVENMVEAGLIEEVKLMQQHLQEQEKAGPGVDLTRGIWTAIGFKELLPYVSADHDGYCDNDILHKLKNDGVEQTKIATRQYARRQHKWIRLQLLRALQENKALDRVVLLDGTDHAQWYDNVESVANTAVSAFLEGKPIPRSSAWSSVEKEILPSQWEPQNKARHCEICNMTLMTQKEWDIHPKSKKHRRATRTPVDWLALYPKSKTQDTAATSESTLDEG